jgi:hypothetical protein
MAGRTGNQKDLYERGILILLEEKGDKQDWFERVEQYAEDNDMDEAEVLNRIVTAAIDEDGDASVAYKGKLGL